MRAGHDAGGAVLRPEGVDHVDEADHRACRVVPREVGVERLTKNGRRTVDVRGPVVWAAVAGPDPERSGKSDGGSADPDRAIMDLVVRQATPTVRPDDVVTALRDVGGLAPVLPSLAVRLAQGPLDEHGAVGDPLAPDRAHASTSP